jgi:hypothetical protein
MIKPTNPNRICQLGFVNLPKERYLLRVDADLIVDLVVHLRDAKKLQSPREGLYAIVPQRTPYPLVWSEATDKRLDVVGVTERLVVGACTGQRDCLAERPSSFGYVLNVLNGKRHGDINLIAVDDVRHLNARIVKRVNNQGTHITLFL